MKNKILIILGATTFFACACLSYSYITKDSSFTKWMNGNEYQENFDRKYQEGYYPVVVEAKSSLTGNTEFRACYVPFPKYPSEAFYFYSYHGITTESFENRHKELKADNFSLAYHQPFETPQGDVIHQATWIKSKK